MYCSDKVCMYVFIKANLNLIFMFCYTFLSDFFTAINLNNMYNIINHSHTLHGAACACLSVVCQP